MSVEPELVTLTYDDESELECEVLGTFDIDETTYIALTPNDEDSDEVYIFIYDGNIIEIEDDEEYEAAASEFEAILMAFDEPDDDSSGEDEEEDPDDTESDEDAPD